jgi:Smg protein
MKEDVLEVLMYLFENYMDDDTAMEADPEILKSQLREAGFLSTEINKAFTWLEDLAILQEAASDRPPHASRSIRVFSPTEEKKLDVECRGLLMFLEQMGVLNSASRELVIDRIMALESPEIDLEQVKWVVLMVLFNQPGLEEAFTWMENMVMEEFRQPLH